MSHHFRSYSEHQTVAPQSQQLSQSNSIIKFHSDSQQSLDRLFNPVQTAVPLRDRQLPKSFFNPSFKANETASANNVAGNMNQFHCRSMSFDQRQTNGRPNFHVRTTSSLAPMPMLSSSSQSSSHQSSSNEFTTSYTTNNSTSQGTNGWSTSTGNSIEDMNTCEMSEQQHLTHVGPNGQHPVAAAAPVATAHIAQPASQQQANFGPTLQPQHLPMHAVPAAQTMNPHQHHPHNHQHHHHHDNMNNMHTHHHHHHAPNLHNHSAMMQQQHQPAPQLSARPGSFNNQVINDHQHQHVHHHHHPVGHADNCAAVAPASVVVNGHNHSRSMSFDQREHGMARPINHQNTLHMRTQSTVLSPMPCSNHSTTHSSHQSSHEFLNGAGYPNQTTHDTSNGWCSSGYSTDDLNNGGAVNWIPGQPQQAHAQPVQQPIMQPQTMQHQHHLQMSQQTNQAPQQLFYHV